MKQFHFTLIIVLLMSVTNNVAAYDFEVDGIYYTMLSFEDLTCEVAPYYSDRSNYSGDITIPEKVSYNGKTLSVTRIGNKAFYYQDTSTGTKLTSVKIPNSITSIGTNAFVRAVGLKAIIIPTSVTKIEFGAFQVCHGLTSIDIPKSVESLGNSVFYNCINLASVQLSSQLQRIEPYTFYNCQSLSSIDIPNNVTSIGKSAFAECASLTSIKIPNRVIEIEGPEVSRGYNTLSDRGFLHFDSDKGAFENCTQLTTIELNNGIERIGNKAFAGCFNLRELIIPGSTVELGFDSFRDCPITRLIINPNKSTPIIISYNYSGEGRYYNSVYVYDMFTKCPIKELWLGRRAIRQKDVIDDCFFLEMTDKKGLFGNQIESITFHDNISEEDVELLSLKGLPLSRLSFGKGFSVIPDLKDNELDSLIIHNEVPPIATGFSNKTFMNCRLYVPEGSKEKYQSANVWKNFWNIIELTPSVLGVESAKSDNIVAEHYGLDGRKLLEPNRGINIIKMSDGTVRKVMIK